MKTKFSREIVAAKIRDIHYFQTKVTKLAKTLSERESFTRLFRDGRVENLCPEEATLGLLNDLLVDIVGRVVHDNGAVLAVNLGVETSLTDEVNDPLFTVIRVEAELGAEVANVHA